LHEFVIHLISYEECGTIALQTNADLNGGVIMANGLLQLRIDDTLRKEASDVYSRLGLDLPTAIRMFLTRSVQVRGIPFSMILPEENYKATVAVTAMKRMSSDAENAGVADMTLDEINAEIEAVRIGK
jgi:addiction module antitoxin, relB/dinJ family